jgi:hypothetical protein
MSLSKYKFLYFKKKNQLYTKTDYAESGFNYQGSLGIFETKFVLRFLYLKA